MHSWKAQVFSCCGLQLENTESAVDELHRVDEINLAEKFQSIGVGAPERRWLVDSGATCHIISKQSLSHYKVVYTYEKGIPVLKEVGDNILTTRGMILSVRLVTLKSL